MRAFAEAWPDPAVVQRVVGQLPWGQNIELISKLKDPAARLWYAQAAVQQGWSRPVLAAQIDTRLRDRQGQAITFQPEHAGKMNFYLAALDDLDKEPGDNPNIGLILYREHNRVVVEYALRSVDSPIGVAE